MQTVKVILEQNIVVFKWRCQLTQLDLYKTVVCADLIIWLIVTA